MVYLKKNYLHITIGIVLAIFVLLFLRPSNGLTPTGVRTLAVSALSVYWWITIGIDWVSLLCMALYVLAGTVTFSELASVSMGNWVVTFVIVICMMNYALIKEGVMERIVTWCMSREIINQRPWVFLSVFALIVYLLNVFLNVNEVVLLMIPVCKNVCEEVEYGPGEKFPTCLYIILMWASLLGFAATPIGHAIPLMVIGLADGLGLGLSIGGWMMVGFPSTFLLLLITLLVCRFVIRPDVSKFMKFDARKRQAQLKPLGKRAKIVVTVYLAMVLTFLFPVFGAGLFSKATAVLSAWGSAPVAILAMSVLIILQVEGKPLLDFKEGLMNVSWGTVFLAVGTFSLGACLTAENTGVVEWLNTMFQPLINSLRSWTSFALLVSALVVILTNFMSIPAVANLSFAVIVPLCMAIGNEQIVSPVAIALIIGILSNMGTMTPPASIPSMMLLGTEYLSAADGFKYGIINAFFSILTGVAIIYPLAALLL